MHVLADRFRSWTVNRSATALSAGQGTAGGTAAAGELAAGTATAGGAHSAAVTLSFSGATPPGHGAATGGALTAGGTAISLIYAQALESPPLLAAGGCC